MANMSVAVLRFLGRESIIPGLEHGISLLTFNAVVMLLPPGCWPALLRASHSKSQLTWVIG